MQAKDKDRRKGRWRDPLNRVISENFQFTTEFLMLSHNAVALNLYIKVKH